MLIKKVCKSMLSMLFCFIFAFLLLTTASVQNAYDRYITKLQKGDYGSYIFILQGLLYTHNYDPVGFDGSYGVGGGTGCLNAVNKFKSDNMIIEAPDNPEDPNLGVVGAKTIASLCRKSYRLQDIPDGIYCINNSLSYLYMTVYQAGTTNGTNVIQYSFSGVSNQKWYVKKLDYGYYSIRPFHDLSFGLDLYNSSGYSKIDIWSCRRPPELVQSYCQWRILEVGKNNSKSLYKISPSNDLSTCVAVENASITNGAPIKQEPYNNSDHEKWMFEKISNFIPITNMSLSESSISLLTGQVAYLFPNKTPANNTDQLFYYSSNNKVAEVNSSGRVTAKDSGVATITIENFNRTKTITCVITVNGIADGNYLIRNNEFNKYITVTNKSDQDNAPLSVDKHYESKGSGSQVWSFETLSNGYFRIRNLHSGLYLCANSSSVDSGLVQKKNPVAYYQWKVIKTLSGNYRIVLKENESLCLYSTSTGLYLKNYTNDSNNQDEWTFDKLKLGINIYYDQSFVDRKVQLSEYKNLTPEMLIHHLLDYSITVFKHQYDLEIYINRITKYSSCVDECPAPLDSVCSCNSILPHHTDFARFVNYALTDTESSNIVNLYLTGHKMCLWEPDNHSTTITGLCYNNLIIDRMAMGAMLQGNFDTAYTIFHEIGHLFFVDDHGGSWPCTYAYNDDVIVCVSCREVIEANIGRYIPN